MEPRFIPGRRGRSVIVRMMRANEGTPIQSAPFSEDGDELEPSEPLVLLLGAIDHEGILSRLKAAGHQYKKKMLESNPENWASICGYFDHFTVHAALLKLTGRTYERLADPAYGAVADQLLSRFASVPHIVFAFESLLSGKNVGEWADDFRQPAPAVLERVNAILASKQLYVVPYQRNAQVTVLAAEFLADAEQGLLFRLYVPSGRLWANEVDRLLQLFRDYLSKVGRGSVRLEQFRTERGTAYEFHGDSDPSKQSLSGEFAAFSHLLDLCVSDPAAAEQFLKGRDLQQRDVAEILVRYSKEARRLFIDLKQERERKLLAIRHRLESELVDAVTEPSRWALIDALVERIVPSNTGPAATYLIDQTRIPSGDMGSLTINLSSQVIETVNGIVVNEVRGDVHLSREDQALLELVREHGGDRAPELASDVHQMSDEAIPKEKRLSAGHRLKGFLYGIGSRVDKLGMALLQKYLESKLGF